MDEPFGEAIPMCPGVSQSYCHRVDQNLGRRCAPSGFGEDVLRDQGPLGHVWRGLAGLIRSISMIRGPFWGVRLMQKIVWEAVQGHPKIGVTT